jgi:hypothetical protein
MIKTQAGFRVLPPFALALFCAAFAGGGCAVNDSKTGLSNVHTVAPGVLVRGAQPGERGFRTLRDEYAVRTVVNLNDATAESEAKVVESLGMRYVALPSNAFRPDADKVLAFLQTVRDQQLPPGGSSGSSGSSGSDGGNAAGGGAVYVHCRHGMDRTGYAVAAYRILVDGWDADRAMAELRGIQAFPHALLFPAIEPFVRGVYRDREALSARLMPPTTPVAPATPVAANANAGG